MDKKNLKSEVISSLFWKTFERIGTQGIQFIVSIILARILLPDDYGVVSMLLVFTTIANVFIENGFSVSLVQKKIADEKDFSSVFYTSLLIASICYLIIYFITPYISDFYNMPQIIPLLRVLALVLFFGALNSVQNARISRNMEFRKLFFSSLGAIIVSGSTGIILAYLGYGPWALVWQQLSNAIATSIILWFTSGWKPKFIFSFKAIKNLFSYGWKILVSSLIDAIYINLNNLVIGKFFSSKTLGNYNKGDQFPKLIVTNVENSLSVVMLSAFSREQDSKEKLKKMLRKSIMMSAFFVFPMMLGLAAVSRNLVIVLLTEKWLGCVIYMQLLCIVYICRPYNSINSQVIKAVGKSGVFLKIEIAKKTLGILTLFLTVKYGVYVMTLGQIFVAIISSIINTIPNKKLLGYGYFDQVRDVFPSFVISLIMFVVVLLIGQLCLNIYLLVLLQILSGIIVYVILSKLLKIESFEYLLNMIKNKIKN